MNTKERFRELENQIQRLVIDHQLYFTKNNLTVLENLMANLRNFESVIETCEKRAEKAIKDEKN